MRRLTGAVIAAALLPADPRAQPAPASLASPLPRACISSPFGPRRAVGPHAATFHNGIDLPAPLGAWVHPAAPGTVLAVRREGAEGLAIDVAHPAPTPGALPFVTRYAHLGTVAPAVAMGERRVTLASPLGRVGHTGVSYGAHLHLELHLRGQPVDPAPYFRLAPCAQAPVSP